MAKVVIDEKITDLSTPWEGYTGQRVEELIKSYLSDHDHKKIGYIILPKALESDGYYHIKCFASEETYNLWLEDEVLHADLLLFNLAIPLVENNGTTYAARLYTSLITSDPIISIKKDYNVPVMYKGTMSSGGITENVGIRGNITIQSSTDGGDTWNTVGNTVLNSVDPEVTSYTNINIGQYFAETNPQQIRLRASYTVYDDEGNIVSTAQSAWLTFSNITYTTLNLSYAGNFENPVDGSIIDSLPVAYTLTGEIERTLHIKITGSAGTLETTRSIGATEYTNALSTWRDTIKDGDAYKILSHGVRTIEAWLTCSDGVNSEGISSSHVTNQILVINKNTPGADLQKSWIMLQNVTQNAVNYVAMPKFLKFSVWVPSEEDPLIPSDKTVDVAFILSDYGTDGSDWNTEYLRSEQVVKSGIQYTLPATIEIENSIDDILYNYLHVQDGEGNDFLYSSCGRRSFPITVDNKEKFSPTAGATFFLNPKNRNNSEANPFTIINAATGSEVESTFSDNFEAINDLWVTSTDDNQKVLRIKAGQKLEIGYDWLAPFKTATSANVTFEIDFKVKNVTDEETPIIQALENLATNFIGLKMSPMVGVIYSRSKITQESQDFRWQEDERTHIAINIVSQLHPTADAQTTLPLCRVFVNGVINREFLFGTRNDSTGNYEIASGEWYQNGTKIVLGQDAADLDIYSIRCYQTELSSANILQDYVSTLPTSDLKLQVRDNNAILGGNGLISADILKSQGKNVLIWHGRQPYHDESSTGTGWWEIHIYDKDGKEDLEHSGTICKDTASLKPTRQGSTANTYYYSNIQTKLKDVKSTIKVSVSKIHGDLNPVDVVGVVDEGGNFTPDSSGSEHRLYINGNALSGYYEYTDATRSYINIVDGWIDGNGFYRGNSYELESESPIAQKLVLKINYASCMQSHLMGGCKMYNDLHTKIVGKNKLQQDYPKARVAKIQAPFHYFTQGLDESTPVYQGPGTFGPGKMDDYTWGYNKKKHPNFCMIEGADNNLPLTDFRIPWDPSRITCEEDDGEVVGYVYNKATSLDIDKCKTVSRSVPVEITNSEGKSEIVMKELDAPSELVEGKIKDMVNFLYKHNPRISFYNGTYESFINTYETGGNVIDTDTFYWVTSGSESYCLKRFDNVDQTWVDAGWNEETNEVEKRDLSVEFPQAINDYPGLWGEINKAFISYIASDARNNFGNYFNVNSALFHYAFVNQFLAGTDNCSKNTYYVLDPETLLWELHQDDVDTTLATDNSGFQSKPYYIDRQNPYPDGSTKTCYEGGYNVLFNLIEAMYESHGEIRSMMYSILTGMCGLITNQDTGLTNSPWGALQKYFFSTQDYFSATAYNEAARIRYEYPSTLGFISDRGVNPISQSMGDQKESEKQFMKRRLVLFASYAEWGDFSRANAGNIGLSDTSTNFGIEACKDIDGNNTNVVLQLVPHQYIYPTGAVGETTHYLRQRCKPGETYTFQINGTTPVAGDTNVVLYAANYYRSFGNLGDLSVRPDRDMTVNGKRLVEFKAIPSNPEKPQFRPNTFTINAPLIESFSLQGCSGINGGLILKNCIRLKDIDIRNTSIESVTFPETSSLTTALLPDKMTKIETNNLPNLEILSIDGVTLVSEVKLAGIPKIKTYTIASKLKQENAPLTKITISGFEWESASTSVVDYLSEVQECTLYGKIGFTSSKDITYDRKVKYTIKWGNIDDPDNDLYMTYPYDVNLNKIYSIGVYGNTTVYVVGTYTYSMIPYNAEGVKTVYGNDFTKIEWSYTGYGAGAQDDKHNWIEPLTGILHAGAIGESVTSDFDGKVKCTMYKLDGTTIYNEKTVHMYYRDAEVGDYLFADGSYSNEFDSNKTVVGVCFYVNPKDKKERLAVSTENLGAFDWGLDSRFASGLTLHPDSKLTSNQYFDLKDVPNIKGVPFNATTSATSNQNFYIRDDNFRDSGEEDGFFNYKGMFSETYNKTEAKDLGKAASVVGYCTTSEDIRDNQNQPSAWSVRNEIGLYIIPSGSRVPWGYVKTLYEINHRNTILSYVVTETDESGEITKYGVDIPVKTEKQSEYDNITDCMNNIVTTGGNANYKYLYYPAPSKCYAFEPTLFKTLKDNEVLGEKLTLHNWFLPSIGDLARLCWYHRQGYDSSAENAIFAEPTSVAWFTKFEDLSYWSSSEVYNNSAWNINFGQGLLQISGYKAGTYGSFLVRPCVAF